MTTKQYIDLFKLDLMPSTYKRMIKAFTKEELNSEVTKDAKYKIFDMVSESEWNTIMNNL